nr:helix-turn-helix domain-containing protein [Kutzneria chonburiensis]
MDLPSRRPKRADARRNFDALLAAARETFAEQGAQASLDEIARRSGTSIATLYRNFPTRRTSSRRSTSRRSTTCAGRPTAWMRCRRGKRWCAGCTGSSTTSWPSRPWPTASTAPATGSRRQGRRCTRPARRCWRGRRRPEWPTRTRPSRTC